MLKIKKVGSPPDVFGDFYHAVLRSSWPQFIACAFAGYVALSGIFTLWAMAMPRGAFTFNHESFWESFGFTVQTLSTIGYGEFAPKTTAAHLLVFFESFSALLFVALTTGLTFSKFSRPKAKFIFSKPILLSHFDGVPALILRVGNLRGNLVSSAKAEMSVLFATKTKEGLSIRRFHHLPLIRETTPAFVLSWTIVHLIDERSPLAGVSLSDLKNRRVQFFLTLEGFDQDYNQPVQQTMVYEYDQLVENQYFQDIIQILPDGTREINYSNFHSLRDESR